MANSWNKFSVFVKLVFCQTYQSRGRGKETDLPRFSSFCPVRYFTLTPGKFKITCFSRNLENQQLMAQAFKRKLKVRVICSQLTSWTIITKQNMKVNQNLKLKNEENTGQKEFFKSAQNSWLSTVGIEHCTRAQKNTNFMFLHNKVKRNCESESDACRLCTPKYVPKNLLCKFFLWRWWLSFK